MVAVAQRDQQNNKQQSDKVAELGRINVIISS
jgi:hypothetical protein